MKNLLIASTALVMTAGVAAADVSVSGNGRMGIAYNSTDANTMSFTSRIRASIAMSGETDGGLSFGGSFGVHDAVAAKTGQSGSIYISGAFGRITMGDVSGAAESVVGDLHGVGMTGVGDFNEMSYLSNSDRPAMRYDYTSGDMTLAVSSDNPGAGSPAYSVAVGYSTGMYAVGLGYENAGATDHVIGFGSITMSDMTFKAIYGSASGGDTQYGVSVSGAVGDMGVSAFYVDSTIVGGASYGLGGSYDLGGGAKLVGGVAHTDTGAGQTRADFGVSFTF
jgi:outer membrane protein OmpU